MSTQRFFYIRKNPNGYGLTKAHNEDAGFDAYVHFPITRTSSGSCDHGVLRCDECVQILNDDSNCFLYPGNVYKIPLNVSFVTDQTTCYIRVAGKSGLTSRGIHVQEGVVDPGFTGEVCCLVTTSRRIKVNEGMPICQLIFQTFPATLKVEDIESEADPWHATSRGPRGFGSSYLV